MPKTDFRPAINGFHFANHFVNNILQLPVYGNVTTLGRCGGMSYAALDYFNARRGVPPQKDQDFMATGFVPADGTPLADYIYRRQVESFLVPSAVKFVTWSLAPNGSSFLLRGVDAWTKQDEFAKLRAAVDGGRPVPLGLVVATDLSGLAHNHQVVAYGYELDAANNPTSVYIYDNNHPDQEVTLSVIPGDAGWLESTGERWRGFFVQDYLSQPPPVIPSAPERAMEAVTKELALASAAGQQWLQVTFNTVRFSGAEGRQKRGRVALTLSANGQTVRWPRSGTRSVRVGQTYELNKPLRVDVSTADTLTVQVNAGEAILDGVLVVDNDAPATPLTQEFTRAQGWGRGRHKGNAGPAAGFTVSYTIKSTK